MRPPGGSGLGGDWWDASPRPGRGDTDLHRTSRGEPIDTLREETIAYRDVYGRRRTMRARVTEDDPAADPFYRTRLVVDADRLVEYVQKRVHAAGRRQPANSAATSRAPDGIDAVDNEIQMGLHLVDAFGEENYPRELSHLVGYYPDDADREPFVLLAERGRPVERFAGRLLLDQVEQFPTSLLRALDLLESAGVVHRWLTTRTVQFDDRHVQITDFRHAVLVGERCGPAPDPRWAAPEAVYGDGPATTKEDVYSVGRVLNEVISDRSGRASTRRGGAERLLGSDGPLGRMVDHDPDLRPPAAEVLAALGRDVDRAAGTRRARSGGDARFVEGLRSFDAIVRRRGTGDDEPTPRPTNGGADRGRR
ncbi:protein kinase [Frankia sp. Mgl5]|uniref:protein kinase domain-containing protein n=1 Tax=Frankia sp. Mgl5 TaxID=2933793 RepID=UPI00200D373E|nr:protein kinase [Frankia sp. Mgl5]MCK9932865.1 protein kinase [Frankia sp. Mgl5]